MYIRRIKRKWSGVFPSAFVTVSPSDVKCINCLGFSLIFHFTADSGDKWRKKAWPPHKGEAHGTQPRNIWHFPSWPSCVACRAVARSLVSTCISASLPSSSDATLISCSNAQIHWVDRLFHKPPLSTRASQSGRWNFLLQPSTRGHGPRHGVPYVCFWEWRGLLT